MHYLNSTPHPILCPLCTHFPATIIRQNSPRGLKRLVTPCSNALQVHLSKQSTSSEFMQENASSGKHILTESAYLSYFIPNTFSDMVSALVLPLPLHFRRSMPTCLRICELGQWKSSLSFSSARLIIQSSAYSDCFIYATMLCICGSEISCCWRWWCSTAFNKMVTN